MTYATLDSWGLRLILGLALLGIMGGCSAAVGRVVGQRFVSPAHAFEVLLPGDPWRLTSRGQAVLTLGHPQLAAGITISVTCEKGRNIPLDIRARHLFFGLKEKEVIFQEPHALNGVPALKTMVRGRLDTQDVLLSSYVMEREGCVYDVVYVAAPQDYRQGEAAFEGMVAAFRFLD
jgi:hypothetical protein